MEIHGEIWAFKSNTPACEGDALVVKGYEGLTLITSKKQNM